MIQFLFYFYSLINTSFIFSLSKSVKYQISIIWKLNVCFNALNELIVKYFNKKQLRVAKKVLNQNFWLKKDMIGISQIYTCYCIL
jgi:hypothetical protein